MTVKEERMPGIPFAASHSSRAHAAKTPLMADLEFGVKLNFRRSHNTYSQESGDSDDAPG